jgi:16S rRNA (cytosine967-C5)-methyltransferase
LTVPARGAAAREAALAILEATRRGELFAVARDRALSGLDDRDRRLAQHIAAGVLRHRRALDQRLRGAVARRWGRTPPGLRDVLRIGLFQLTELSRVPPHAAVSSAVEMAKTRHGVKSAAFVNAVLRRTVRETRMTGRPAASLTPQQKLAAEYSHPDWLVARWCRRFGPAETERLLRHNNRRPPLRLQPARWTQEEMVTAARARDVPVETADHDGGIIARVPRPEQVPGFVEGGFVVQGPAQARFIREAGLPGGIRVWDACAAPGGKAAGLARITRVVASDRPGPRLRRLRETVDRAAPGVPVFAADARQPPLRPGAVDAVWLDAPCSGTGTIARHPDTRWRLSPRRLNALLLLQRALLDGATGILPSGGFLVYTTCSLEAEENEVQVARFLDHHPAFRRARPDSFVFPPDTGVDGGYLAVLVRA